VRASRRPTSRLCSQCRRGTTPRCERCAFPGMPGSHGGSMQPWGPLPKPRAWQWLLVGQAVTPPQCPRRPCLPLPATRPLALPRPQVAGLWSGVSVPGGPPLGPLAAAALPRPLHLRPVLA
jgi:hypothetical protein